MSILQIQGLYKKFGQNNIINGLDLEVKEIQSLDLLEKMELEKRLR